MVRWLVVGAGRCGLQIARAMFRGRLPLAGVVCRSQKSQKTARSIFPGDKVLMFSQELPPETNLLIAVQDRELAETVEALAQSASSHPVILHTSGSLGPEILAPMRTLNSAVGVFHPLVPFPHPLRPRVRLHGAVVTVAGDPQALEAARALARSLRMRAVVCSTLNWPLYHAAATLVGPLFYALQLAARAELVRAGFPSEETAKAVATLARAVVNQCSQAQGWELLTGPLARGDRATVQTHLSTLDGKARAAYQALSALVPQHRPGTSNHS